MVSVFLNACGIICIDYLGKAKSEEIKQKWPYLSKKKLVFHRNNASIHKSFIAMTKINELKFELLLNVLNAQWFFNDEEENC